MRSSPAKGSKMFLNFCNFLFFFVADIYYMSWRVTSLVFNLMNNELFDFNQFSLQKKF